jgi:hypothetical protein
MKLGCKAEGAAQGYTILGGIVLIIYALQRIANNLASMGSFDNLMEVVLGIALLIIVLLAFDACGFVHWKLNRSGLLLAIFGLIAILIVSWPGILAFNPIGWLQSLDTLAGLMILLAGILLIARS